MTETQNRGSDFSSRSPATHRTVLHLDLDAFFCAVEERDSPELKGKAFAVGGSPDARGVVASCSYAARKFGVRSAMPMSRARRLCPDLIIVKHRHGKYAEVSRDVMALLLRHAEDIEQISIDEAFLGIAGDPPEGAALARRIQSQIQAELDLPCSFGVATNKLVAKIATDVGKASVRSEGPPNAIQVVPPGMEAAFLAPLPTVALWGVGPKTGERLSALGIHTIGDIASWPPEDLARRFGKHGADLARRARGIDDRPIEPSREAKSISRETTFARDVHKGPVLRRTLLDLSESVGRRLRRANLAATTVKIKVRWPDFTTLTRQITLPQPTGHDQEIYQSAVHLFEGVWREGRAVRLLGVGVTGLGPPIRQLSLWEASEAAATADLDEMIQKEQRLKHALGEIENRFGPGSVWWGDHRKE